VFRRPGRGAGTDRRGRTVDHGHVHSLHAYVLRPGHPRIPIIFDVDRIATARASPRGASSRSSTAARSSTVGVVPRCRARARAPVHDARRPDPTRCRLPERSSRTSTGSRRLRRVDSPRARIDTRSSELPRWLDPAPTDREPEQLVWFPGQRGCPTTALLHACHRARTPRTSLAPTAAVMPPNFLRTTELHDRRLDHPRMWFTAREGPTEWSLYHRKEPVGRKVAAAFAKASSQPRRRARGQPMQRKVSIRDAGHEESAIALAAQPPHR